MAPCFHRQLGQSSAIWHVCVCVVGGDTLPGESHGITQGLGFSPCAFHRCYYSTSPYSSPPWRTSNDRFFQWVAGCLFASPPGVPTPALHRPSRLVDPWALPLRPIRKEEHLADSLAQRNAATRATLWGQRANPASASLDFAAQVPVGVVDGLLLLN